jgi:hypothetical protein
MKRYEAPLPRLALALAAMAMAALTIGLAVLLPATFAETPAAPLAMAAPAASDAACTLAAAPD